MSVPPSVPARDDVNLVDPIERADPPSGLGDTTQVLFFKTDIDQVRLEGVKVSCLPAMFGKMGLVILKPTIVPHRGFTENLDMPQGADLYIGEIGHYQAKLRFNNEASRTAHKSRIICRLQSFSTAGAIIASAKPFVLTANKCTIAVTALVDALKAERISKISVARHAQKIPMEFGFPPLVYMAHQGRSTTVSLDVAWNWPVAGGVPIFNAPWAHHPSLWMFAELGVLRNKVGTKIETIKKYGAVQYAVPAKYGMWPGSRITVYPGAWMHFLKGVCGNLAELGTPKSVFVLRNRTESLKQAAEQMV